MALVGYSITFTWGERLRGEPHVVRRSARVSRGIRVPRDRISKQYRAPTAGDKTVFHENP